MRTSHIENLADVYIDFVKSGSEYKLQNLKNIDKIIVWPVTLSTGAIVLILANIKQLNAELLTIKLSIALYISSILLGLLAGMFNIWAVRLYGEMELMFLFLSKMKKFPHNPILLRGNESSEEIYYLMQESFKIDNPQIIERYYFLPEDKRSIADENARKYYSEYSDFSASEFERAAEIFDKLMIDCFGYDETYFERRRAKGQKTRLKRLKAVICNTLVRLFYITSIVSFSIATIRLAFDFWITVG